MHTIKLTIEYDGTAYSGWQFQPNGLAVQQVMEGALARLLGARVNLYSSGRTDAGVHARGMIASFSTERSLPLTAYTDGMNCLLPSDIAVIAAEEVAPDFNPRHDARESTTATQSTPPRAVRRSPERLPGTCAKSLTWS